MAYVNPLDPTTPLGSDPVSAGDDMFRSVKAALIERVDSFFTGHDVQPWQAKTGSGALSQWIVSGPSLASVRLAYTGSGSRNIDWYADSGSSGFTDGTTGATFFSFTYAGTVINVGSAIGSTGQLRLNGGIGSTIVALIGGSTVATFSSTGLGALQFSGVGGGAVYVTSVVSTGAIYGSVANTGGNAIWSVESSAGGGAFANTAIYAAAFGTTAARSVQLVTNNRVEMTIASGGNITVPNGTLALANTETITPASGVQPLVVIGTVAYSRFSRNEAAFGGALVQFDRSGVAAAWIGMDTSDNLTFQRGSDAIVALTLARGTGNLTAAFGINITAAGLLVTGGVVINTGGLNVVAGDSQFQTGIRQSGSIVARFENTFGTRPIGSTGIGLEVGVSGGGVLLQAWNMAPAFASMVFQASVFTFSNGPLTVGTLVSTGAAAGNVVVPNGTTYASVNGAGTAVLGMLDMDASNRTRLQLNSAALAFNNPSTAASATAGGATALPTNPTGYLITTMNGTTAKIPYYNN